MSADLERDLGAWTRGELARDRLLATYGAEAAGSVALHDRLTEMAAGWNVPAVTVPLTLMLPACTYRLPPCPEEFVSAEIVPEPVMERS